MIKKKGTEYLDGQMGRYIKAIGNKGRWMGKVKCFIQKMGNEGKACGIWERESNGNKWVVCIACKYMKILWFIFEMYMHVGICIVF